MISMELRKAFDIPVFNAAEECLDAIIPDTAWRRILDIYARYGRESFDAAETAEWKTLYAGGFLNYAACPEGAAARFTLANFYTRLDIFVISEYERYRAFSEAARRELDDWYFDAYYKSLVISKDKAPTRDKTLTLEEALAFIQNEKRGAFLARCDCRALASGLNGCEKPHETCITFRNTPNSPAHRGIIRPINKEEALSVLREADAAGLMHRANPDTICNCCSCCCYLSRAKKRRDSELNIGTNTSGVRWPEQKLSACFDASLCAECGECIRRCPYHLFSSDSKGAIVFKGADCTGCGLCVETCASGALTMRKTVEEL